MRLSALPRDRCRREGNPFNFILLYLTLLYLTLPDFTSLAYLSRMSYAEHASIPEERLGGLS